MDDRREDGWMSRCMVDRWVDEWVDGEMSG